MYHHQAGPTLVVSWSHHLPTLLAMLQHHVRRAKLARYVADQPSAENLQEIELLTLAALDVDLWWPGGTPPEEKRKYNKATKCISRSGPCAQVRQTTLDAGAAGTSLGGFQTQAPGGGLLSGGFRGSELFYFTGQLTAAVRRDAKRKRRTSRTQARRPTPMSQPSVLQLEERCTALEARHDLLRNDLDLTKRIHALDDKIETNIQRQKQAQRDKV